MESPRAGGQTMLELHFLNVGHGDCTFIKFDSGRLAMIDVNNSKSLPANDVEALAEARGLTTQEFRETVFERAGYQTWEEYYRSLLVDPYDFYVEHFGTSSIFRYIQTHPDLDHMSGLHRFFFQELVTLNNFWDTANTKTGSKDDFLGTRYDYRDWEAYQALRAGTSGDGTSHKVFHNLQGEVGSFWAQDGVAIWGPTQTLVDVCNLIETWNNSSYVLRLAYGGRTVVLPGDAGITEWEAICDSIGEDAMSTDILKAAHHGRESGYSARATSAMSPSIVICSVGKKPSTDASDEYAAHGATVLSTRFHGSIQVQIWFDGEVWVNDHAGNRIATLPPL